MSRERQSRQRKRQGYSTYLGKKVPPQGPARPFKDKWRDLDFYKKAYIQLGAAFTALGLFWVSDAVIGTNVFSPAAWIGVGLYTTWRLWVLRKESK